MALPRVCLLGRSFLSKGSSTRIASSVFRSTRFPIPQPQRQFTSISGLLQEVVAEQAAPSQPTIPPAEIPEAQRSKNARSIVVMNVPKRINRAAVESLFNENGLEIVDIELRMDRFTFFNDRYAFIELANEEQAKRATELLHENETLGERIYVRPLKPEYIWRLNNKDELGHLLFANDSGLHAAIQPIIDDRRVMFSVKTPGWSDLNGPIKSRNAANREVVIRTLAPFGVESISPCSPNWGDLKQKPRFLCFADMKTKQGADEAIRTLHDTEVEGRKIWLSRHEMSPWKAYQLGKMATEKLKLLQEKGLAPQPEEIDEKRYSQPFVQKKKAAQRKNKPT